MNTLKVFTAFSGYDSQCMALDRLNIDYSLVGWSEIDKYAIQAHNAVYPQYADRNYGDISKIDWMKVPDFDLFTYSFPCTDISSAGQQKGLTEGSGTRSSLLWECRKTIEIKHPKYLLMENVKALTSDKFMPYLRKWLSFLESMGYSNFTKVLNSKDYGVPQNRERVFVVSILGDERYYFPKPFKLCKRLKDVLESDVDESYYLSKKMIECFVNRTNIAIEKGNGFRFNPTNGDVVAKAVTTCAGSRTDDNYVYENKRLDELIGKKVIDERKVQYLDTYNMQVRDDISGTITTRADAANNTFIYEPKINQICNICEDKGFKNPQIGRVYDTKGISPTIDTMRGGGREPKIVETTNKSDFVLGVSVHPNSHKLEFKGENSVKEICPTLRATDYKCPSCVWESSNNPWPDYRIRKLTERECFRLMGVSEENIDKMMSAGISKTQLYKMAGNSIVVDVLYYIFKKMFIDKKANKGEQQILFG